MSEQSEEVKRWTVRRKATVVPGIIKGAARLVSQPIERPVNIGGESADFRQQGFVEVLVEVFEALDILELLLDTELFEQDERDVAMVDVEVC